MYQKEIIYMGLYKDGGRLGSAGFLKVENRDRESRLSMKIQNLPYGISGRFPIRVYNGNDWKEINGITIQDGGGKWEENLAGNVDRAMIQVMLAGGYVLEGKSKSANETPKGTVESGNKEISNDAGMQSERKILNDMDMIENMYTGIQEDRRAQGGRSIQNGWNIQDDKDTQDNRGIQDDKNTQDYRGTQNGKSVQDNRSIQNDRGALDNKSIQNDRSAQGNRDIRNDRSPQGNRDIQNDTSAQDYRGIENGRNAQSISDVQNDKSTQDYRGIENDRSTQDYRGIENGRSAQSSSNVQNDKSTQDYRGIENDRSEQDYRGIQNKRSMQSGSNARDNRVAQADIGIREDSNLQEDNSYIQRNKEMQLNTIIPSNTTITSKMNTRNNKNLQKNGNVSVIPISAVDNTSRRVQSDVERSPRKSSQTIIVTEEMPRPTREKSAAMQYNIADYNLKEDKWEQILDTYEQIHPYGDERVYVKLEPKDFVILRSNYQHLVNNSFLLHGFYNYRYVILGKEEDYYLGVPGVFYEREKMVALMFGFEAFECPGGVARAGEFGYYLRKVEL